MAEKNFTPKDFEAWQEYYALQEKIGKTMRKNMSDFNRAYKDIGKSRREIERNEKELLKTQEQIKKASGEELKFLQQKEKALKQNIEQQKAINEALKEQTRGMKGLVNYSVALGDSLKNKANKSFAIGNKLINKTLNTTKKIHRVAKGLFEEYSKQEDSIRRMAIDVGITGKNQDFLRKTLYKTAAANQRLGLSASETAEIYGSYVESVGRLIPLSEQASYKLAEMAKGTALGADGAAQMAGNMEVFGISIERAADYVEDATNMSEKMGVNSGKVLKTLNQNMRQAAGIRFRDGVAGMTKMAALSSKLRLDMSAVLGFAQDLWEPEKAIETAANLQMMGGAFAKMGDPLRLMFLGRNNPTELMNNLADAAASVAKRGRDGEYEIPTMELQKLQQIAQSTGLEYNNLVETARTAARQRDIGNMLSPQISDEAKEYISSIAEWSDKDGGFVIQTSKGAVKLGDINEDMAKTLVKTGSTLQERAREAQSFLSYFRNVMESFKNLAFSFISGVGQVITEPLKEIFGPGTDSMANMAEQLHGAGVAFGNWLVKFIPMVKGFIDTGTKFVSDGLPKFIQKAGEIGQHIINAARTVREFINSPKFQQFVSQIVEVGKTIIGFGKKLFDIFGPAGILVVLFRKEILGGLNLVVNSLRGVGGLFKNMFNRTQVVTGSVHVTNMPAGGFGGGGMHPADVVGGRAGGRATRPRGRFSRTLGRMSSAVGGRNTMIGRAGLNMAQNTRTLGTSIKGGMGLARGMRLANPLMWASMGMDVGRGFLSDQDSALGKGLGIGSSAASGAAMGAMLGSIIPGVGNIIGGIIGGVAGAIHGAYREFTTKGISDFDQKGQDSVINNIVKKNLAGATTMMADGAVMPDGNVIKTAKGKMYSLSPRDVVSIGQPGNGNTGGGSSVNVNIGGTIKLTSDSSSTSINLDSLVKDPIFVKEMTKLVIEQTRNMNR